MKFAAKAATYDARVRALPGEGTRDPRSREENADRPADEDAGRAAYLAGFRAAQALIFERTGTVTKTHKGAHTEFARLTRNEPRIDTELRRFLPQAYDLKAVCDYELGPDAVVPHEKAVAAVETAHRFVECISALVGAPGPTHKDH